ncbi:hypothetical protein DAEQUDRAFT_763141 [Daedalea quercina L-15889]|uniref:Uncharacterized protein n=1 Tax=Daedalea quercina L-15889 TaxID=1314783 RepID=A0A165SSP1_9APHY|nr:hypothetical protein DAEQUDRAFT_763141 [Daedalea quercina L-15889]
MSATPYKLFQTLYDKTSWTVPVLDGRNRPVPWAAFGDYSGPVHAHFVDDDADTGIFTVASLQDTGLYSIPEEADDFTGSSCVSHPSWPPENDEDAPTDDELEYEGGGRASGAAREVCHSFIFRGAQYETVRTIIRANGSHDVSEISYTDTDFESDVSSASSTSDDPDDLSDPGIDTPLLSDSGSRAPTPDPLDAVRSGAARIAARQHLEEDLDFREHEWLLQQIGCGRVEIWVTEEFVERTESGEEQRPRVFFPLPSSQRQSVCGSS